MARRPRTKPVVAPPHGVRLMLAYFAVLDDPRIDRTKLHSLHNIIVMTLCGTLCGADGWDALEDFAETRADWFGTFLDLPNGTPSADTFRRVFNALDPVEFERTFRSWVRAFTDDLAGQVVAIDGKTLRGAVDRAGKGTALHLLHVWAAEQQLLLAHAVVDGAGGEIPGIPALLRCLDVRGAIITTDANGCTAPITQAIRDADADYVLALKANRSALHTHVVEAFAAVEATGYHDINTHQTIDTGHGRVEDRTFRAMALPSLPPTSQVEWADLATIVQVDRVRTVKGATTIERQYFVSNLPPDAAEMARAVRTHWGVENQLHWALDVGLNEDACRVRDRNSAANFATIKRFVLALLKRETSVKRGLAAKRRRAGWDNDYLLQVLCCGVLDI
jgi:predicted transposase YbfD/YdcC